MASIETNPHTQNALHSFPYNSKCTLCRLKNCCHFEWSCELNVGTITKWFSNFQPNEQRNILNDDFSWHGL